MKNRGSALLITLIFLTILATILLSLGRSLISQTKLTASGENSAVAFDMAEAGIEDALMRFRKDAVYNTDILCPSGQVKRYKLNGSTFNSQCVNPSDIVNANTPTYDLSISSKVSQLGFVDSSNSYAIPNNLSDSHDPDNGKILIKEGETLEFDVTGVTSNMTIYWEQDSSPSSKYIQIKYQLLCPSPATGEFVEQASDLLTGSVTQKTFNPSTFTCAGSNPERRLRIKAFIGASETGGVLSDRKSDATSSYAIRTVGSQQFGSYVSTITATGYYGGAKRQLAAKVDKRNGALLGIFDYAVFSGGGSVGL